MFVPFDQLPNVSRIWIYQANRPLTPEEKEFANHFLTQYCDDWKAHGQPLRASFQIVHDHFVILAVDENFNSTSGCSIDDSVRAIKHLQSQTGIDFFNRKLVAFKTGDEVVLLDQKDLKQKYEAGLWKHTTLTFNNLIQSKGELSDKWIVAAGNSWLKRYIPQHA